jgi:hypothetical protein
MCFGGKSMPKVNIPYQKPDFGPLPSLRLSKKDRIGAQYGEVRTGQQQRSLLMPLSMGDQ